MNVHFTVISLVLVTSVAAQNGLNESRGPLAGAATAIFVEVPLGGLDGQTRVHRNGLAGTPLAGPTVPLPPATNPPDLRTILGASVPAGLDFDDFSMGRDDVPIDANGFLDLPPSTWTVMSFSVTNQAQGVVGERIAEQVAEGQVGAALFSLVLPGSELPIGALPSGVVDEVERSHSPGDLGIASVASAEVDAVDFTLMFGLDQGSLATIEPGFGVMLPTQLDIYFTVSHQTRGLVPVQWWGGTAPSGATILRVRRLSPTAGWTAPAVFRTFSSLGLGQNEDIDGLALDAAGQRLLYSVVGTTRNQFLFGDLSTDDTTPQTVKKPGGPPISDSVGTLQSDDVDAICTLDPAIGSSGAPPPVSSPFGSTCGSPRPGLLGTPSVHASAYRRYQGGQVFFDTSMVGWPPITDIGPGIAVLFVTLGNDLTLIPVGPIQVRDVTSSAGDPRSFSLPIPGILPLSNAGLTFRWVAIDALGTEIAEAWPVQVFL